MLNQVAVILSIILLTAFPVQAAEKASEQRLEEVTTRGRHVMPFSLERTTHIFTITEKGGLQQVVVKDASDTEEVKLIRAHLSKISQEFMRGDFSDPAKIHGENMPGLAELQSAQPGQIKIVYRELPDGAEIRYSSDTAKLIQAIHLWFDTQLRDHADHAVSGHPHHRMRSVP